MSDNKPNADNEEEHHAPSLEAATEAPTLALEAWEAPAEATLNTTRKAPDGVLNEGRKAAEAALNVSTTATEAMRKARKRPLAKTRAVRAPATSYTVEAAANLLSLDPTALRARLRRAQRREGTVVVADLGGGISGFKLGKSWRLRFPER